MTSVDEEQTFNKGEKVLCYEPDPAKAKVLYDSKLLNVFERRDALGFRYYEYKVHFQGWNRSWDRWVRADCLLKDNEENRKLQKLLAEEADLQKTGAYSYKDTKTPTVTPGKKKRTTQAKATTAQSQFDEALADPLDISYSNKPAQLYHKLPTQVYSNTSASETQTSAASGGSSGSGSRSRDNSAGRKTQLGQASGGDGSMRGTRSGGARSEAKDKTDVDSNLDSDKHIYQEERVMLRISERLREYMEYDYNMVVKFGKQHALPARMPVVSILESFVRQRAVELAISIKQDSSRGRNTQSRNAKLYREYDRVMSIVCLLKEIVDGIRIYFEFFVDNHLLYKEEREHTFAYYNEDRDNLKNSSMVLNNSFDYINPNCENELILLEGSIALPNEEMTGINGAVDTDASGGSGGGIEYEKQLQKCLQYIDKNSGKSGSSNKHGPSPYIAAYNLPMEMRDFLIETFKWRLLPVDGPPEKSQVFGAPHLARLLTKMPEYLNVSPMSNEKLEDLVKHLDMFINYLENHKQWFDKENYVHANSTPHQEQLQKDLLASLEQPVESSAIPSN